MVTVRFPRSPRASEVDSTIEAIKVSGWLEAMIIDPVYAGKSVAGLIDLVTSGDIGRDSTVLDAHLAASRR